MLCVRGVAGYGLHPISTFHVALLWLLSWLFMRIRAHCSWERARRGQPASRIKLMEVVSARDLICAFKSPNGKPFTVTANKEALQLHFFFNQETPGCLTLK